MKKIGVLIKEPGRTPRHVNISDTLENLQKTVGGHLDAYKIARDLLVICDEEGRLKGKPWCCNIGGADFVGTIVMCGVEGGEFADLPITWKDLKRLIPGLWEE